MFAQCDPEVYTLTSSCCSPWYRQSELIVEVVLPVEELYKSHTFFFFFFLFSFSFPFQFQVLPDEHARDMCLRFADMESKLGEIDRARAIYSYCSQICDPRVSHQSFFSLSTSIQTWPCSWRWPAVRVYAHPFIKRAPRWLSCPVPIDILSPLRILF